MTGTAPAPPLGFQTGGDRTAAARITLRITAVLCVAAAILAPLHAVDGMSVLAACLLLALDLMHVVTAIAFLAWLHRAHENLVLLGLRMRYSSTATVALFFVPIANLLLPTLVVGDVWSASAPTSRLRRERIAPTEVTWWWLVYVAAAFAYGAGRLLSDDEHLGGIAAALLVAGSIGGFFAARFTLKLVEQIDRREAVIALQPPDAEPAREPRPRRWSDYLLPVSRALEEDLAPSEPASRDRDSG